MNQPLISIIIPTYNRAHLIAETIESVLRQDYSSWELIIIDDGSQDDTEKVVSKFMEPRLIYHKIDHSGRLGKVRNEGIKMARGEYIAFLDSDDLWRHDKLTFQLNLLDQHPQASFIFGNANHFGEGSKRSPDYQNIFVGNVFRPLLFEGKFCVCMPSLLFKKNIIPSVGLMNEKWRGGGDIDFLFRVGYLFTGIFANERLVDIRKHEQSTSEKLADISYVELLEMYSDFFARRWITRQQLVFLQSHLYYKIGLEHYRNGDARTALKNFRKHTELVPWQWKGWVRFLQASVALIKT